MKYIPLLASILIAGAIAAAAWWAADRPVPVSAEWSAPLASVSFAPYRRGESPLTKVYPKPDEIEQDMRALVGRAKGIRTYTSREGLEVVPDIAARLGLKVTLGAWLGADRAIDDQEVAALIDAANRHPDSIQRVIVGNEVLLRQDLPPDVLIGYIRRVKAAIRQPVSYADVWRFYVKHPEVVRELDYLTIHILPFWEDEPVPLGQAERHTVDVVDLMRKLFPGKPILIGEAGWPSLGRDRGPAVVDVAHEASFVRRIANLAARHDFDYNIVEAFDQPWKAELENTVGAAWGVLDADRQPKFPMTGPVPQIGDWIVRAGWSIALGAVAALLFGRRLRGFGACLVFSLAAQILSWLMITTGFHDWGVTFQNWQRYWLALRVGLPALILPALLSRLSVWLGQASPSPERGQDADPWHGGILVELAALYAAAWSLLLLFDGRYRDIPEFDFCLPAGGLAVLMAVRVGLALRRGGGPREALAFDGLFPGRRVAPSLLFAWILPLAALASAASEVFALANGVDFVADHPTLASQLPYLVKALVWNREMDVWAVMQLGWAVPFMASRRPPAAPTS